MHIGALSRTTYPENSDHVRNFQPISDSLGQHTLKIQTMSEIFNISRTVQQSTRNPESEFAESEISRVNCTLLGATIGSSSLRNHRHFFCVF